MHMVGSIVDQDVNFSTMKFPFVNVFEILSLRQTENLECGNSVWFLRADDVVKSTLWINQKKHAYLLLPLKSVEMEDVGWCCEFRWQGWSEFRWQGSPSSSTSRWGRAVQRLKKSLIWLPWARPQIINRTLVVQNASLQRYFSDYIY